MNKEQEQRQSIYLVLYCFIFFSLGIFVSSIGALIPYLAKDRGKTPTQYSFLFMARTIGSVAGFLLYRFAQKKYDLTEHKVISFAGIIFFTFMIVFVYWASYLGEWICLIFFGMAYYWSFTCTNISLMTMAKQKAGSWLPLGHALFGLGALMSPQFIRFLGLNTYFYVSFLYLVFAIFCLFFVSPKHLEEHKEDETSLNKAQGSLKLQILISLGLFLNMGVVLTVSGWFPSYSVITGISTEEGSTIYATLYWSANVIFKFVTAIWKETSIQKLKIYLFLGLILAIVCLICHFLEAYWIIVFFGSFLFGATYSSGLALMLAIPIEFNIRFRPDQVANMMISTFLSFGLLAGLTGVLMEYSINNLFYSLIVINVGQFVVLLEQIKNMKVISNKVKDDKQLQMVFINDI